MDTLAATSGHNADRFAAALLFPDVPPSCGNETTCVPSAEPGTCGGKINWTELNSNRYSGSSVSYDDSTTESPRFVDATPLIGGSSDDAMATDYNVIIIICVVVGVALLVLGVSAIIVGAVRYRKKKSRISSDTSSISQLPSKTDGSSSSSSNDDHVIGRELSETGSQQVMMTSNGGCWNAVLSTPPPAVRSDGIISRQDAVVSFSPSQCVVGDRPAGAAGTVASSGGRDTNDAVDRIGCEFTASGLEESSKL